MNQIGTIKLNANSKKEYIMKVSNMIVTSPELKAIRAFFTVTLGCIQMRDFKLIKSSHNGKYRVAGPDKIHTNRNIDTFCNVVKILDPKVNDMILELALKEYKEIANVNTIEQEN